MHTIKKGDYCLYCKDIDADIPTSFNPCLVLQDNGDNASIQFLDYPKTTCNILKEKLIFIKKAPLLDIEIVYNSPSHIGGAYNVTTQDGTHLKASFYFDNKKEQNIAEESAKRYVENYFLKNHFSICNHV